MEACLLVASLLVNRHLAGLVGFPDGTSAAPVPWLELLDRSRDAFVLVAPWLGVAASLFSLVPAGQGAWAELQTLSPFSRSTRFLVRAAVATLAALVGTLVAGMVNLSLPPTPAPAPIALVLLARTAPLMLAVSWALVWALRYGSLGVVASSLLLWPTLVAVGYRAPRWSLLAVPATAGEALPQLTALALSLVLFAWVAWRGRRAAPAGTVVDGGS